ncbi:glycosyltransferase family 2 protein [Clostridium gasigenes]|uniref:glycosyltransferase family 2 protein n=1 Tax=Clostridium gasigenes TaxID=94869 RepID=UPI001626FCD3|nr:glycosyltransferase family 2 protein [Clostridium gasigenes]MBB6624099.1 glycosyltransferase family 2 protein [Clostridium gasigenes]
MEQKSFKLSICIPTYNRADLLSEAIKSVVDQANDNIEIIISDNGSKDHTRDIVRHWQNIFSNITYFRFEENQGFDINMLKSVDLATGDYCLILGDDDAINKNMVQVLLDRIKSNDDLYVISGYMCDEKMNKIAIRRGLNLDNEKLFIVNNANDFSIYIDQVESDLSFVFAFISSTIFLKRRWEEVEIPVDIKGSHYDHVYKLLKIVSNKARIRFLSGKYFLSRKSKNEFSCSNSYKHFYLDVTTYTKFIKEIFEKEESVEIRKSIGRLLLRGKSIIRFMPFFSHYKYDGSIEEVEGCLEYFYIKNNKVKMSILFSNYYAYRFYKKIKSLLIKRS